MQDSMVRVFSILLKYFQDTRSMFIVLSASLTMVARPPANPALDPSSCFVSAMPKPPALITALLVDETIDLQLFESDSTWQITWTGTLFATLYNNCNIMSLSNDHCARQVAQKLADYALLYQQCSDQVWLQDGATDHFIAIHDEVYYKE